MPFNELHEKCGIFAIKDSTNAAISCILGLHSLQHRGQESFGVTISNKKKLHAYHDYGHVNSIFDQKDLLDKLSGNFAIGHVRYSTSGGKLGRQPITVSCQFGEVAIAHNGNLINTNALSKKLSDHGCITLSDIDTEVIGRLISISKEKNFLNSVIDALKQTKGAFSLVIMTINELIGVRDPAGIRPLVIGKLNQSYVMASETCALDIIEAEFIREINPGELIIIDKDNNLKSLFPFKREKSSFCIFEYVYFARPDSIMENQSIYEMRKNIGEELAKESPAPLNTNMIVPVPDSGMPAAIGYSRALNIPLELGIVRSHYIGRTFIQPTDNIRRMGVKLKHNANSSILKNKVIVLIDDSIVRGTTLKNIISLLRNAGAKEVHLRIASPPTLYSCFYGIDTPKRSKLMAVKHSISEMSDIINCDSLKFLSIDGLYQAIIKAKRNNNAPQYCDACFTGQYPIDTE